MTVAAFLFHQLRQERPDWNAVRNALQRDPQVVAHARSADESNFLHLACYNNAPLSVVQLIVRQHPNAVKEKNQAGNIPLHYGCGDTHSLDVIKLLVQQDPETMKERNSHGNLPLHVACSNNQSFEVIQWLVQQYPNAFKEKNKDSWLPVHLACARKQSLEVIQYLVQQHPNSIKERGKDGNLPLHAACGYVQSLEVIQWLVQQHPEAVKERNSDGKLPLHAACGNRQPLKVIQWLVQQYPNAIKEKSKDGNLPLHLVCEYFQSLKVIQWLVQQHPEAVKERNSDGKLPLHAACGNRQPIKVIQWLVQQYPNAIKEKDTNGWIPLHFACAKKQPLEVIQWLVQQQPDLVTARQHHGFTPLDLARLSLSDMSPDLETVQWLEAVASGQIKPQDSPILAEKKINRPPPQPTFVVDQNLAKRPAAASNDDTITKDCRSVLAVLVGKNEMTAVSPSYIESIRTEEVIGTGFFGTVHKGTDVALNRSFAIKAFNTDVLCGGHSANVQTAEEAFHTEMKAFSLFRHPNIESLYAYAFPDTVRSGCHFVCELAEKGSLDTFWKSDLGPNRLSLFRRRIQIALDVMTAIQFLHNQTSSSFRCDIQSSNIVLKRDFTAQLIDCGLAKFVADANVSRSKNAAGYFCPIKGSDGVQFEHSCDILSFGVVLGELLTGKLQNDTTCDVRKGLDPALGYDTLALPKCVQDFADLAICCVKSNLEDRPAGEAVMAKLWRIWSQCCGGASVVGSVPGTLELTVKSKDKCNVCRTFSPVSPQSVCIVCKSAEDRRAYFSFTGESRRKFAATKAKCASSSLPLLGHFDMRLNNPVPRLFVIVPLCIKTGMSDPKVWLRSSQRDRYCVYFVCIHSMKAIAPSVPIIVTKCWLEKIAPVLAMSLHLLQLGLDPEGCVELGFGEAEVTLKFNSTMIAKLLEAVSEILTETASSDLLARLRGNQELDAEDIGLLNGDAYELVVETAGEERGWRECMEPVRKDGSPQIFWVSKEVACDTSNGYDIVPV